MAPNRLAHRLVVGVAVILAVGVVLFGVAILAIDSHAVESRVVALVVPRVSASLGRETRLASATLDIFPDPRVALHDLSVAGRPGEPPLLEMKELRLELDLWPLLRSLGKNLQIRSLVLVQPTVNLVKAEDGTWSYEGLGTSEKPSSEKPSKGPEPSRAGDATAVAVAELKIEKAVIRVIDRTHVKDDTGVALSQLDLLATRVGPGLPLDASISAALASPTQNLSAHLSVARLPSGVPTSAGEWPAMQGEFSIGPLMLDRIRPLLPAGLGNILRGGNAKLGAHLTTLFATATAFPEYRLQGDGALESVELRGQPASGRFRATVAWGPARPQVARLDLTDLSLRGPGVDIAVDAFAETAPVNAWFVLTGNLLDLDALMGALPRKEPEPVKAQASADLLPASTRDELSASRIRGQVALAEVRSGRLVLTNVKGKISLSQGVLTVDSLDGDAFAGRVTASGTTVDLGKEVPSYRLAAKLDSLDVAKILSAFSKTSSLAGSLSGNVNVTGAGAEWATARDRINGTLAMSLKSGAILTTDLRDEILGPVSKGIAALERRSTSGKVSGEGGRTNFKDISANFKVENGMLIAQSPILLETSFGELSLEGRIGVDGSLLLRGNASIPNTVLSGNTTSAPPPPRLSVPLAITGTLEKPKVSVNVNEAAAVGNVRARVGEAIKAGRKALGLGRSRP